MKGDEVRRTKTLGIGGTMDTSSGEHIEKLTSGDILVSWKTIGVEDLKRMPLHSEIRRVKYPEGMVGAGIQRIVKVINGYLYELDGHDPVFVPEAKK